MQSSGPRRIRRFTGYHMTTILVVFFAIVIAVNVIMARYAIGTFGGTVVENSYVASQKFNGWLKEARREKALGWTLSDPKRDQDHLVLHVDEASSVPLTGAAVTMRAEHPLGQAPERDLRFMEIAPGQYRSLEILPAGRWKLRIRVVQAGHEMDTAAEVY